jgi:hypothetical protein
VERLLQRYEQVEARSGEESKKLRWGACSDNAVAAWEACCVGACCLALLWLMQQSLGCACSLCSLCCCLIKASAAGVGRRLHLAAQLSGAQLLCGACCWHPSMAGSLAHSRVAAWHCAGD